jgi:hypothetical protein
MGQTSYSINIPAVAYPGQLADLGKKDILTALAVAASIVYGTLVVTDESNTAGFDQLAGKAPAVSTDITVMGAQMGIAIADQARAQDPSVANPVYPRYSAVSVLRQGRIWVLAETGLADGSNPFVRFTANGSFVPGVAGAFRSDADSAKAAQLSSGQAVVRGTTSAAGYAVIEINLV